MPFRTAGGAARRRPARLGLSPEVRVRHGWPLLPQFCGGRADLGGSRTALTTAEGGGVRSDPRLRAGLCRPDFSGFRAATVPGPVADGWTGSSGTSHGITQWRNLRGDLDDLPAGS